MFTPRGPVVGSFQHTLWPRRRVSEAAVLLSRVFGFVFSWYKVIIALSLCWFSGAPQRTVYTSIIAAKARSNKNHNTNAVSTKWRLQTADRVQNVHQVQNTDRRPGKECRLRIILSFRLIRDNMSSYNLPSVTQSIVRFTVVCLVAKPLNRNEAKGDLVMIQTLLLFKCKLLCYHAN